jgi:hypothetical protein
MGRHLAPADRLTYLFISYELQSPAFSASTFAAAMRT